MIHAQATVLVREVEVSIEGQRACIRVVPHAVSPQPIATEMHEGQSDEQDGQVAIPASVRHATRQSCQAIPQDEEQEGGRYPKQEPGSPHRAEDREATAQQDENQIEGKQAKRCVDEPFHETIWLLQSGEQHKPSYCPRKVEHLPRSFDCEVHGGEDPVGSPRRDTLPW